MSTNKNILYCSFWEKPTEVRKLIAGPTVFICDECVEFCMDIIKEESKDNLLNIKMDSPPLKKSKVLDEVKAKTMKKSFISCGTNHLKIKL
ncbi:MAG: hypothetical protein CM15mL9_330 [uncultured marine virus]|nr:MAG: hypothetical protein CM15mL9_330 [uncultured marine virus]